MKDMNCFKLKDRVFTVKQTEIFLAYQDKAMADAYVDPRGEGLYLFLGLYMNTNEYEDAEGETTEWSPDLYHNSGIRIEVGNWKELAGMTFEWTSAHDENYAEAGCLYVFGHEDVTAGKIEIQKREGDSFTIRWSGKGHVFWNDEYGENVPFEAEFTATLSQIRIKKIKQIKQVSDEELLKEVSEFIDLNDFRLTTINDEKAFVLDKTR